MVKIFATDTKTNERFEISDLYWFEEAGVHTFFGNAFYTKYTFEILVNGKFVYPIRPTLHEGDSANALGSQSPE